MVQAGGEAVTVDAPVISFGATAIRRAAVVVHTDEDGRARTINADDPLVEVDEGVIAAHQDDFEVAAEGTADALGGIEREVFFFLLGDRADGAAVFTAMTGIDDDGAKAFGARAVAVNIVTIMGVGRRTGDGAGRQKGGER